LKQLELIPIKTNDQAMDKSNFFFLFSPIIDNAKKLMINFSFQNEIEHQVHIF